MANEREILGVVEDLQRSYQLCFGSPAGKAVLADLARICHANETCFAQDPRDHAFNEGTRAVWLRITSYFSLTTDDLVARYKKSLTLQPAR